MKIGFIGLGTMGGVYGHISSNAIVRGRNDCSRVPLARLALIAPIHSSAIAPISEPTAHRHNARAHYTRLRRHASVLYAHPNNPAA